MTAALAPSNVPRRIIDYVRLLDIVRGEYVEMPGLRLSRRQAQRLWAIDAETCDAVLAALEYSHFLEKNEHDEFVRVERS